MSPYPHRTKQGGCDHCRCGSGNGLDSDCGRIHALESLPGTRSCSRTWAARAPHCYSSESMALEEEPPMARAGHSPTSRPRTRSHCLYILGSHCCSSSGSAAVGSCCSHWTLRRWTCAGVSEKVLSNPARLREKCEAMVMGPGYLPLG